MSRAISTRERSLNRWSIVLIIMVEATREACRSITELTHRLNCSHHDCSVHDGHRRYRHNLWRLLLLVGEDQHTRVSTRNVEQVREIATVVGLFALGLTTGSASASPTVSDVNSAVPPVTMDSNVIFSRPAIVSSTSAVHGHLACLQPTQQ